MFTDFRAGGGIERHRKKKRDRKRERNIKTSM